jgi:serine/threonine-protein kinase
MTRNPASAIPKKIGRYEIEALVGEGGMGRVYKAIDPLIERTVAIKTLGVELEDPEAAADFRRRFFREARSAGRVVHPNVVTVFDMGEADGAAFIAMEYVEGRTLRQVIDGQGALAVEAACRIAIDVAAGLQVAHDNGVVHRDVKPANILIAANGAVKLMDFGIARVPDGTRTKTGIMMGSPSYVAPEQIIGEQPVDGRADQYALAVVLYESLTGQLPLRRPVMTELLYAILNELHDPPSVHNHRVPAVFERIFARALAKHPDDRYASIAEFARDVREWRTLPRPTPDELTELRKGPLRTLERRVARRAAQE